MSSIIKVDTIQNQSGANIISESSNTITVGASGDTINVPGTEVKTNKVSPTSGTTLTLGDSGDTVTVPTGATLTVPNGGLSGQNYPAFEAYVSSDQTIGDLVQTKTEFDTEVFDTDGYYDNSTNYRFTPLVAGKYYVYTQLYLKGTGDFDRGRTFIRKNGFNYKHGISDPVNTTPLNADSVGASAIIEMNGSTDYLEIFAEIQGDITNVIDGSARQSYFGAFRIGD